MMRADHSCFWLRMWKCKTETQEWTEAMKSPAAPYQCKDVSPLCTSSCKESLATRECNGPTDPPLSHQHYLKGSPWQAARSAPSSPPYRRWGSSPRSCGQGCRPRRSPRQTRSSSPPRDPPQSTRRLGWARATPAATDGSPQGTRRAWGPTSCAAAGPVVAGPSHRLRCSTCRAWSAPLEVGLRGTRWAGVGGWRRRSRARGPSSCPPCRSCPVTSVPWSWLRRRPCGWHPWTWSLRSCCRGWTGRACRSGWSGHSPRRRRHRRAPWSASGPRASSLMAETWSWTSPWEVSGIGWARGASWAATTVGGWALSGRTGWCSGWLAGGGEGLRCRHRTCPSPGPSSPCRRPCRRRLGGAWVSGSSWWGRHPRGIAHRGWDQDPSPCPRPRCLGADASWSAAMSLAVRPGEPFLLLALWRGLKWYALDGWMRVLRKLALFVFEESWMKCRRLVGLGQSLSCQLQATSMTRQLKREEGVK